MHAFLACTHVMVLWLSSHVTPNHALAHGLPVNQLSALTHSAPLVAWYNACNAWTWESGKQDA